MSLLWVTGVKGLCSTERAVAVSFCLLLSFNTTHLQLCPDHKEIVRNDDCFEVEKTFLKQHHFMQYVKQNA